ncbi:aldehyde dehydrogenase family protein, partial [Pseudomonas lurida]|uniref:aldehyde dehydrogenase family protein n=1 Tax=Pseudomonas lurida TaxID=244566 RepID=UPI0030D953EF
MGWGGRSVRRRGPTLPAIRGYSMPFATTNPFTGETLKTFPTATDAQVVEAIGAAHQAFRSWRETSFAERARIMT